MRLIPLALQSGSEHYFLKRRKLTDCTAPHFVELFPLKKFPELRNLRCRTAAVVGTRNLSMTHCTQSSAKIMGLFC
jgi:hypothetical protein